MNTLEQQTAVEQTADGKYRGEILEDWKMWVPVGGYLTSIALRAAQASSTMVRPVSVSCHCSTPVWDKYAVTVRPAPTAARPPPSAA